MLRGIDPVLTGDVLRLLDQMGHSDLVVISDAHFPAYRLGPPVVDVSVTAPRAVAAVRSVIELDTTDAVSLMDPPGDLTPAQREIVEASGCPREGLRRLERFEFYVEASRASLIIRTAEVRIYGNVILSKGVTTGTPPRQISGP